MLKQIFCTLFFTLTSLLFSQNVKGDLKKYERNIKSKTFKEEVFYEVDSVRLILNKELNKKYGKVFSEGFIIGKWVLGGIVKKDSCMSFKDAKEIGLDPPKILNNFKGKYVWISVITELNNNTSFTFEFWVKYCIYSDIIYVFEASFDKDPIKNKDAKLGSLKFSYNPI